MNWSVQNYEAPEVSYLNLYHEGVLCQSGTGMAGVADWNKGSGSIDF